jgi:hypothetical protein
MFSFSIQRSGPYSHTTRVPPISRLHIMAMLSYYTSSSFLYAATTNIFNVIAILSAILFLLDPILFAIHTGYKFYLSLYPSPEQAEPGDKRKKPAPAPKGRVHPATQWWKWYLAAATIHLFDAWFFRTIIPFYERAQASKDLTPDNLEELADITRLLWGIIRGLSLVVVGMEIWEKRLVLKSALGEDYKNPKWAFAASYLVAPAIVGTALVPVGAYLAVLGVWHSIGFFWSVVREAFTPDWRSGQDVFVKYAETVVRVGATGTPIPKPVATGKPVWKVW